MFYTKIRLTLALIIVCLTVSILQIVYKLAPLTSIVSASMHATFVIFFQEKERSLNVFEIVNIILEPVMFLKSNRPSHYLQKIFPSAIPFISNLLLYKDMGYMSNAKCWLLVQSVNTF